jgi:hypothetical protein
MAGNSFPTIDTRALTSHAIADVDMSAVIEAANAIFLKNMLLSLCFLGFRCALQSRILFATVSRNSFRG